MAVEVTAIKRYKVVDAKSSRTFMVDFIPEPLPHKQYPTYRAFWQEDATGEVHRTSFTNISPKKSMARDMVKAILQGKYPE
jgi:hypothetical protein